MTQSKTAPDNTRRQSLSIFLSPSILYFVTPALENLQICLAKLDTIAAKLSCWMIISKSPSLSWGQMELEDVFFLEYEHGGRISVATCSTDCS